MKLLRASMMALFLLGGAASCDLFLPPTKTDKGQLYSCGDPRYDNYFEEVHKQQVASANWSGDERAARKPITTALGLAADAPDWSIMSGTREHRNDPNVVRGAEDTARAQHDRATRLRTVTQPLVDLASRGQALIPTIRESFRTQGEDKVREVRNELNAAVDAMNSAASKARSDATDADDFGNDLRRSLAGQHSQRETPPAATAATATPAPSASTAPAPSASGKPTSANGSAGKTPDSLPPPKPPKADPKPDSKPQPKPDSKPDPKPDAKPDPKPDKPPDEVFNP